ncbi:MAG: glycoside hydrolase family 65 protein, partial [Spirochaetia bacterium]
YFWDTETYMLPVFLYTQPEIAKALIEYRFRTLDKARARARELSHAKGACFPWRTINGDEASPYFPAGTAQYHINADIAHSVINYFKTTGDLQFLADMGLEVLIETARLWVSLGDYIEAKAGKFCINQVTGPDEYTTLVNNNVYTNLMAKQNMEKAVEYIELLHTSQKDKMQKLAEKVNLQPSEVDEWKHAAKNMYIPYDEETQLYPQDDSFFEKAVWNFKGTPEKNYPLLLHYHPLVINRYQVCKQADLILAELLLGDCFSKEQKVRDYNYYEKITTHDSSLSTCIFSILASELGMQEKAYQYFIKTARTDLDDHKGNTAHGVHAANMAGTWLALVSGFAGMRNYDSGIHFAPALPQEWASLKFRIFYRGSRIELLIEQNQTTYTLVEGEKAEVYHYDTPIELKIGSPYIVKN